VAGRGATPKGEYVGKSKVFSTRIRPDLRDSLDKAARKSGRSVSQEVEHRLRRTFVEDERISELFGDRQTYLVMRTVAIALERAWNPGDIRANWLNDPFAFDLAMQIVSRVLEAIRPPGEIVPPADEMMELALRGAAASAGNVWEGVQQADPTLPLTDGTRKQHFAGVLKTDLGEIAMRPKIIRGTAKDLRRYADNLAKSESAKEPRKSVKKQKRKQ
jgi:hypothetical protein